MSESSHLKRPPPASSPKARKRKRSRFSNVDPPSQPAQNGLSRWNFDIASIPVAPVATLRINQDKALKKKVEGKLKLTENDMLDQDPETNPYFDPTLTANIETKRASRPTLSFVESGKIAARADKLRARAEEAALTELYREKIAARVAANQSVPELPPYIEKRQHEHPVPDVEWWDAPFIREGTADVLNESKVTKFIHHPKRIAHSIPERPPPIIPVMLTEKERKRLRRQRRQETLKETQEMIAVGLLPTPPPKVKLSNMMRVLANEVSADPTKVEMDVRKQVEERRLKHEEDNEKRRKTKEERHVQIAQKQEKDRNAGMNANVYRVTNCDNPAHRFKVVMNARQLGLSGALVLFQDCNVVVVEGGTKALGKFRKLMLRRIDWSAMVPSNTDGAGASSLSASTANPNLKNEAVLVWEGTIAKASFYDFKTIETRSENGCRMLFRKRKVEHYWDLCVQASPLGDSTLGVRSVS